MYAFHSPSREETQKLAGLCKDMLRGGGKNGFVHYIRQHAPKKMTKEQLEKELRHNLMASLFLGQQSLANGAFWVIVRLAQEPELLKEIRHNRSTLPEVIAEELRIHPPSSPFLMPYLALEDDDYKGLQIGAGRQSGGDAQPVSRLHIFAYCWGDELVILTWSWISRAQGAAQ